MTEPELLAAIDEADRCGDRVVAWQLAARLIALWADGREEVKEGKPRHRL